MTTAISRSHLRLVTMTLSLAAGACASEEANHAFDVQLVGTKGSETRHEARTFDLDGPATDRALVAVAQMSDALAPLDDTGGAEGLSIRVRLDGDAVAEHHISRAALAKAGPALWRFLQVVEGAAAEAGNAEIETRSSALIVWGAAAGSAAAAAYLYRWLAPSDAGTEPDGGNAVVGIRG